MPKEINFIIIIRVVNFVYNDVMLYDNAVKFQNTTLGIAL